MTEKTTNKKKLVIISSVAAAMIILLVTLLCSCKGNTNTESTATADEIIGTSIQTITEIVTDAQGSTQVQEVTEVVNVKADGTVENAEDSTKPTEKETNDNKKLVAENGSSSSKTTSDNSSNNNTSSNSSAKVENQNKPQNTNTNSNSSSSSATSKPSSNSSTTSTTSKPSSGGNTAPTTSSKVWHEAVYEYIEHPAVTEQVWVVDKESYTYEETIYEKHARTFCNDCNADITEDPISHVVDEALNGGKGSYRSELVKIAVGTETVTVPEQGHYETKIIKEAYTEKKLIKEAGYY